jgi:hypothetical protein
MDWTAVVLFPVNLLYYTINKENILKPELINNKEKYEQRNEGTRIPRINSRTV